MLKDIKKKLNIFLKNKSDQFVPRKIAFTFVWLKLTPSHTTHRFVLMSYCTCMIMPLKGVRRLMQELLESRSINLINVLQNHYQAKNTHIYFKWNFHAHSKYFISIKYKVSDILLMGRRGCLCLGVMCEAVWFLVWTLSCQYILIH